MKKQKSNVKEAGVISRAFNSAKWAIYDLNVKICRFFKGSGKEQKPASQQKNNRSAMIFCVGMLAYPIIWWLIFYVYANIDSVLLAFKRFDLATGTQVFYDWGDLFYNFKSVIVELFNGSGLGQYFLNGALFHLCSVLIAFPFSLIFSYIIYKKAPLAETFKVILYLPSILSSMVIALVFKYFTERALTVMIPGLPLLLLDDSYNLITLICYSTFLAMPGSVIINVSTMSRTPTELIEYGELEGISMFEEFIHLVLPLMYPVIEVQLLGVFVGFFTAQGPLYAIYAENAPASVTTFGYYMFTRGYRRKRERGVLRLYRRCEFARRFGFGSHSLRHALAFGSLRSAG